MDNTEKKGGSSTWLWVVGIVSLLACGNYKYHQNLPVVRVDVSFCAATLPNDSGDEAIVRNTNNASEDVTVEASRPSSNETKTWHYTLAEHDYQEIGSSNGWAFQSGDKLAVSEDGYRDLETTLN